MQLDEARLHYIEGKPLCGYVTYYAQGQCVFIVRLNALFLNKDMH